MAPNRPTVPIASWIGNQVAEVRQSIRWTQADLGRRVGVAQSVISDIESGAQPELSLRRAEMLFDAMGARLRVSVDRPFIAEARQRDPVHIRCSAHVARRLMAAGWEVRTEVEVGSPRSRGWIDLLAHHAITGTVLVIEVKTELHDLGELERSLSWYEREAWSAARRQGWRPRQVGATVLLLASQENDRAARRLRPVLDDRFPLRAAALATLVERGEFSTRGRGLAMIDPRSRRHRWIKPLGIDGRRRDAPYRDYLDAVRRIER